MVAGTFGMVAARRQGETQPGILLRGSVDFLLDMDNDVVDAFRHFRLQIKYQAACCAENCFQCRPGTAASNA